MLWRLRRRGGWRRPLRRTRYRLQRQRRVVSTTPRPPKRSPTPPRCVFLPSYVTRNETPPHIVLLRFQDLIDGSLSAHQISHPLHPPTAAMWHIALSTTQSHPQLQMPYTLEGSNRSTAQPLKACKTKPSPPPPPNIGLATAHTTLSSQMIAKKKKNPPTP